VFFVYWLLLNYRTKRTNSVPHKVNGKVLLHKMKQIKNKKDDFPSLFCETLKYPHMV
jgi:hypothetical protein